VTQDGYTLAEVLAALFMVGLAIGGLTMGAQVIGRGQAAAMRNLDDEKARRMADTALIDLLSGRGPFLSSARELQGDGLQFRVACESSAPCGGRISTDGSGVRLDVTGPDGQSRFRFARLRRARFIYVGTEGAGPDWPRVSPRTEKLRALVVLGEGSAGEDPVASVRLWREQPVSCQFDPVLQDCRAPAS
jgi:hypothetical protein